MLKIMNKTIIWLIVIVIVVIGGYALFFKETGPVETIKVGVVGPLSGNQANYGTGVQEGMDLAYQELKDKKIKRRPVEFVFEDSAGDVKTAVSAVQKLISIDKAVLLVSAGASQEAVALAPIAQEAKVPFYTVVSQAGDLTDAGDYVFRGMPEIALLANKIAEVAYEKGFRKAATLNANYNQAVKDAAEQFIARFTELGGQVVINEDFGKDTTDFRTHLGRIKAANPDLIFLNGLTNDAAVILKQKGELGLRQQFVSQGAVEDKKIVEVAGAAADGMIFATYNAVPPADFVKKIKAKIGSEPRRWNMEGYEAVQIIYKALAEADELTPEGIKNALADLKEVPGLTQLIKFDEKGNALREVYLKIIRNGQFELYSE